MSESAEDSFVASVADFLDARRLVAPYAAVVVGVSGGPDSVALLAALRRLARDERRAYRLTVAHLHHGLRAAADEDAEFVADLARRWDLPCLVERADAGERAKAEGQGVEQAARMLRYEFLRAAAENVGAGVVAVGHHADDNAETILYRIVRGTHLRGLAGIPAARSLGGGDVRLIRPLLWARREQVVQYVRGVGLPTRTDETNADVGFRRNFIRHELLPLLRQRLNPRADEALLRLADAAGQVEDLVEQRAADVLGRSVRDAAAGRLVLAAEALAGEHPAVVTAALRGALERLGAPMRSVGAERLAELSALVEPDADGAVTLPGGAAARRERDELVLTVGRRQAADGSEPSTVALSCPGETELPDGRRVVCEVGPPDQDAFEARRAGPGGEEMLDADALRGRLWARGRREGDAFVPLGAPGRQTVSDFLTNAKLPARERERVVCICDELGIVYLAPLRIDERVKVTQNTGRIVRLRLEAGGRPSGSQ
jgi:tRNA(Ile)-lysidine synthase